MVDIVERADDFRILSGSDTAIGRQFDASPQEVSWIVLEGRVEEGPARGELHFKSRYVAALRLFTRQHECR